MGWTALVFTLEVILAAGNDMSTEARAPRIPIARMRSLYRLDAVSQRLAKLRPHEDKNGAAAEPAHAGA